MPAVEDSVEVTTGAGVHTDEIDVSTGTGVTTEMRTVVTVYPDLAYAGFGSLNFGASRFGDSMNIYSPDVIRRLVQQTQDGIVQTENGIVQTTTLDD